MNKSLGERPFRLALNPNSATHGLPKLNKTEPIDHQMLLRPFRSRDSSWLSPALSRVRKQTQQPTLCFVSSVEPEIREKSSRQGASSRRQVPQDRFEKTLTLKRSSRESAGQHLFLASSSKRRRLTALAILFVKTQNWVYKSPWYGSTAAGLGGWCQEEMTLQGALSPAHGL